MTKISRNIQSVCLTPISQSGLAAIPVRIAMLDLIFLRLRREKIKKHSATQLELGFSQLNGQIKKIPNYE